MLIQTTPLSNILFVYISFLSFSLKHNRISQFISMQNPRTNNSVYVDISHILLYSINIYSYQN